MRILAFSSLVNNCASCFLNECVEPQFLRAFVCFHVSTLFRNTEEGNKKSIKNILRNVEKIKAVLSIEECVGF